VTATAALLTIPLRMTQPIQKKTTLTFRLPGAVAAAVDVATLALNTNSVVRTTAILVGVSPNWIVDW
jgi:hypothetical protein